MRFHLERVVDFLVSGVGPERVVPDGALHLSEEALYLAAVPLGVGLVEGEGHEEALDRTKEIGGGWAAHAVEEVVEIRTRRRRRGVLHRNFARRRRRLPCGGRPRAGASAADPSESDQSVHSYADSLRWRRCRAPVPRRVRGLPGWVTIPAPSASTVPPRTGEEEIAVLDQVAEEASSTTFELPAEKKRAGKREKVMKREQAALSVFLCKNAKGNQKSEHSNDANRHQFDKLWFLRSTIKSTKISTVSIYNPTYILLRMDINWLGRHPSRSVTQTAA